MTPQSLAASFLGAVAVAALAVGAAFGVHALVGDQAASPSDLPSGVPDSTVFCTLMTQLASANADASQAQASFEFSTDEPSLSASPATDDFQVQAQAMVDSATRIAALLTQAAVAVRDPDVAIAFTTVATASQAEADAFAAAAASATNSEEFATAMFAALVDPTLASLMQQANTAASTVDSYVQAQCGFSLEAESSPTPSAPPSISPTVAVV